MDKKIKIINFKITVSEFLKKFSKDKKYFVITHGCQSNIHDSEIIKGILNKIGFSLSDNIKESSIIVINTCAVREKAENKVFAEIGNFKNKKK
ncbi:tRNA (N6-isopentenyl adenosine(37)-C2)-methylthiotransferase MiaB, partial [bacterium]|nr:tRNA (N6-isopentenyl adenosine(37)-C2)-methylthiotransferase MiaB [bacterium]